MVRETRAQKRKQDEQNAREAQEADPHPNKRARTLSPKRKGSARAPGRAPRAAEPPGNSRDNLFRGSQGNGESSRRNDGQVNPTNDQRLGNPELPQRSGPEIRKNAAVRWQGRVLPRFDTPCWRIRKGVPTLLLHVLALPDETDAADDDLNNIDDIEIDSQDDERAPEKNNTEGRQQNAPLPPASQHDHTQQPPPKSGPKNPSKPRQQGRPQGQPSGQPSGHPRHNKPPPPPVPDAAWGTKGNPLLVYSGPPHRPLKEYPRFHKDIPEYDAADWKARIEGVASEEDITRYGNRLAKFIRSPIYSDKDDNDTAAWRGVRPLGRGGFGMAGLWEKLDENGALIDQLVVKQIGTGPGRPFFAGQPMEVSVMEEIAKYTKDTGTENTGTVALRKYKRFPRREVHRLYLEFCPYGDLYKLIKQYRARKRFIPAGFIWNVFYQLAVACEVLESLPLNKRKEYSEYVHRDIKPHNVFLAKPNKNDGEVSDGAYPMAKLGDFGLVICTSLEDPSNPRYYRGDGTPGYKALEQEDLSTNDPKYMRKVCNRTQALDRLAYYKRHESPRGALPRILSHTNVWGIGAVIFELMTLKRLGNYIHMHPYHPADEEDDDHVATPEAILEGVCLRPDLDLNITKELTKHYPEDLIELMQRCLRPNPAERPRVEELLETICTGLRPEGGARAGWRTPFAEAEAREREMRERERIPWGDFDALSEGSWEDTAEQEDEPDWYTPSGDTFKTSEKVLKEEEKEDSDESDGVGD
ncbi:MAG: hypothetical protein Q9208_004070 [Pyrenodesmia sp. 3 TL-2023]